MSAVAVPDLDEALGGSETLAEILADLAESLFPDAPRPFTVPSRDPEDPVGSRIRISGGWDGEVVLRLSRPFAQHLAERLFLLAPGTAGDGDVLDVLGELVNIVGGNVKAMLPGENQLSLPRPRLGDVAPLPDGLTSVVLWDAQPVQISMIPDAASAADGPTEGHLR